MPIGVEHPIWPMMRWIVSRVLVPVMPIGVEHLLSRASIRLAYFVLVPVMPIGVEHYCAPFRKLAKSVGPRPRDANRR